MWAIINFFQILIIFLWTAVCGILTVVISALTFFNYYQISGFIGRNIWSPVLLFVSGIRVKISGKEHIDTSKTYIYVANHESLYDIPALFNKLPVFVSFLAKKELKKVPFMGWAMMASGYIFIDRSNREKAKESLQKAGEEIKSGKNAIIFPEGTRTKTGKMGLFKRGAFLLSKETGIEIIPISIKGARECLASGSYKIRPGKIQINIGSPISPNNYENITVEEFANVVREVCLKLREND